MLKCLDYPGRFNLHKFRWTANLTCVNGTPHASFWAFKIDEPTVGGSLLDFGMGILQNAAGFFGELVGSGSIYVDTEITRTKDEVCCNTGLGRVREWKATAQPKIRRNIAFVISYDAGEIGDEKSFNFKKACCDGK